MKKKIRPSVPIRGEPWQIWFAKPTHAYFRGKDEDGNPIVLWGRCMRESRRIYVKDDLTPDQVCGVIAHEIEHAFDPLDKYRESFITEKDIAITDAMKAVGLINMDWKPE